MMTLEKMREAMEELDEDVMIQAANDIMAAEGEGADLCMQACQEGLEVVGRRFEDGEYFVGDLVFAGELMGRVMDIIRPALSGDGRESIGKMILCTVKGDLHDIGKNIVRAMLEAGGLEVLDLGIDVEPEEIVQKAKENGITIIGLSGVLTLAIDSMKDTVEAFKAAGLREGVHIIVGGNPVNAEGCSFIGADAWAILPQETVRICREWAAA
ncbi:MAG: cobalamin-binding protein [Lachnospiraceae bacterium]|jgi:dimethylamine corrinoid protein|nr:cobalamin-binding protein [Lachnospiraceae bacterium]MCI9099056.1 cobalamin-binding protein [Lachnospiraceae bacterium]